MVAVGVGGGGWSVIGGVGVKMGRLVTSPIAFKSLAVGWVGGSAQLNLFYEIVKHLTGYYNGYT